VDYHIPVMPLEAVDALRVRPGGIYVDGTLGGSGHSAIILERLKNSGRLIGIDQDMDAIKATKLNIETVHDNFHNIKEILRDKGIAKIDGMLLDLGVSSYQLDTPERGFSYRLPGKLDMRMNQESDGLTAADIVNSYTEEQLVNLFFTYGEERFSRRIARAIIAERPITMTEHLSEIIERVTPRRKPGNPHPATRCFMALRIYVNNELHPLDDAITAIVDCLNPGGRVAVITFHSLEDRIVKRSFNRMSSPCECPRDIPYCVCNKVPLLKVLTRKPILPSTKELETNNRASSAKLRVGEKLDGNQTKSPKAGT